MATQLDLFQVAEKDRRLKEEIDRLDALIDRLDDQGVDTHYQRQELSELLAKLAPSGAEMS